MVRPQDLIHWVIIEYLIFFLSIIRYWILLVTLKLKEWKLGCKVIMLLHMYIKGIIIVIVLYLQESCINSPAENSEVSEMAAGQESMQMDIQGGGEYDLNS